MLSVQNPESQIKYIITIINRNYFFLAFFLKIYRT